MVRGGLAAGWGQSYDVYRLGTSTNSIFDSDPILTGFTMIPSKTTTKKIIENETFVIQVYVGTCDDTNLELGDILVENGFESETGNVFAFAQRRPKRQSLFVRCESSISITRPQPHGGQSGQQPALRAVPAPGYIGIDKASEWPLVLNSGVYSFATGDVTPAAVPAGIVQLPRIQDASDPKIPVALYRERFVIYVPLLSGTQLQELDRFNFPNSDRYEGASLLTTEQAGLNGYILLCEKLGT
jgi:hypothetical protein